jgi:pyruvate,water dikinase
VVAVKLPRLFATIPSRITDAAAITDTWWRQEIARAEDLDLDGVRRMVLGGVARFELSLRLTAEAAFAGAQPVYDQIARLAELAGAPELAGKVVSGHGSHVETRVVADLWELSRGRLEMASFLDRHGYHGPLEGEVSARVWREDPAPVESLAHRYAALEEADTPTETARRRATEGRRAEEALMAALPTYRRPAARLVLKLARTYLPLRGIGKIPFLQSLDVVRAAARRAGALLADGGHLAHADDVFYLTLDEVLADPSPDWAELIEARRHERASYQELRMPTNWRGRPEPDRMEPATHGDPEGERDLVQLSGIPASPGVVEGPVRVVTDPSFTDIEEGEILVATTTDPSWASVMFFSSALVVDIGGALSHAAVVARELGVPCVMGTGRGTQVLRTGDICRVDGTRGTVELIKPSDESSRLS